MSTALSLRYSVAHFSAAPDGSLPPRPRPGRQSTPPPGSRVRAAAGDVVDRSPDAAMFPLIGLEDGQLLPWGWAAGALGAAAPAAGFGAAAGLEPEDAAGGLGPGEAAGGPPAAFAVSETAPPPSPSRRRMDRGHCARPGHRLPVLARNLQHRPIANRLHPGCAAARLRSQIQPLGAVPDTRTAHRRRSATGRVTAPASAPAMRPLPTKPLATRLLLLATAIRRWPRWYRVNVASSTAPCVGPAVGEKAADVADGPVMARRGRRSLYAGARPATACQGTHKCKRHQHCDQPAPHLPSARPRSESRNKQPIRAWQYDDDAVGARPSWPPRGHQTGAARMAALRRCIPESVHRFCTSSVTKRMRAPRRPVKTTR